MQDLTTGSITRHLARTTGFMLVMMVFQTLYFLVDLYWVGRLGTAAVAGVAVAGNLTFIVLALGQMLGVGTTTVIAHAAGRRDQPEAQRLFNQSQLLSVALGAGFLALGMLGRSWYARALGADAATARLAGDYLRWFIPAMALQFPLGAMGAALRGIGLFKPGVLVSTVSVVLNMILAPFLIFGWGTGRAFGVQGAAMSSLLAIAIAIAWMATYFTGARAWIRFDLRQWVPALPAWRRMLGLGLPAGFEFAMMAVYQALNYSDPFGLCDSGKPWCALWNNFRLGMALVQGQQGTCSGPGCHTGALFGLAMNVLPTARAPMIGRAVGVRYMGAGEAAVVEETGAIPAVNAAGRPRVIHYTTDVPTTSAAAAQAKYMLPEAPTHMVEFPMRAVRDATAVEGPVAKGATQAATSRPINGAGRPRPLDP